MLQVALDDKCILYSKFFTSMVSTVAFVVTYSKKNITFIVKKIKLHKNRKWSKKLSNRN